MAKAVLNNGETGSVIRGKINDNFTELYDGKQPIDADLTSWAGVTRASGYDTFAATPTSANLRALLSDETGTGAAVFAASPTITGTVTFGATGGDFSLSMKSQAGGGTALDIFSTDANVWRFYPWFDVKLAGLDITIGNLLIAGTKVVGAQGASVADATDAASAITQLNALLARCRAHGLIAT